MKELCFVVLAILSLSNAFPQQELSIVGIEPPPGCRYECRLTYDTVEEEVTEEHCERRSRKVCQPDERFACTWHEYQACSCHSERECTPVEVDECHEVPDVHKFIYYVEEPVQVSVQKCDKKWHTLDDGTKVWINDPTGDSCQSFLTTRTQKVEKWREEPYQRQVCEKVYKDHCLVRQLPEQCETVRSCDVTKREPFPEKCTVETYKHCEPVHKLKTKQITKRVPYLTCDGQLDGSPRQYSEEEIFNINVQYPAARRCTVSNIPTDLLPEAIPDVIEAFKDQPQA